MREHDYRTQLLQGKVALITGASRGIGAATAKLFAKHGAIVGINYHTSAAQAGKIVESICAEGGHAIAFRANVNDAEQVEAMVEQVERDLGPIDILVLNAMATGSKSKSVATSKEENSSPFIPFLESKWDLYHNVVVGALAGVYLPARSVVPFMAERKRGNVIAISSLVARLAYPGTGALAAGKASVEAFMRVLATELGPYGIQVNVVSPGAVETEASAPVLQGQKEMLENALPLRRIAQPEDIAGAILLLATDGAQYLTGNYLAAGGGSYMP
ncbi:SDR family NAD(P)-dependent oxidoreductase [Ktedonospora formicarum]|uniref:Beta-ketoacyl-ACP reductase n=1 Tax=Ktedonospora formicarum TaxID=2778364 RepID=A0A8J3HR85_9CHLR|nr:SDR family oxidoreductase [Ktedonospora formicarum]GHO42134.1 beta-ketoacyl-ACP reductase [Ktedonospora formicarum]